MKFGTELMQQADALARYSQGDGVLTRAYLTPEHRAAGEYLLGLMRAAGMQAEFDALGNVVGLYAGANADAPVILTGSHMDSVANAGKYDGLFGILSAVACVGELHRRGVRLPCAIEVVAFGDEEGLRFGITMIGSAALAGQFEPAWLDCTDAAGVTLRDALRAFGGDPDGWAALERDAARIACVIESHIEQGPVLLDAGLPLGVVTAIAGCSRINVAVRGVAGHAGTVPMNARRDALCAAAEIALAGERLARASQGRVVCTTGRFGVADGGAINVIPGAVRLSFDIRAARDDERRALLEALRRACLAICAERAVELDWQPFFELAAAPCDAGLQAQLAASIAAHGVPILHLPSGAGHDAMKFAHRMPTAMLFVRCGNGGISHNPLETMSADDAELATAVLLHFLEQFQPGVQPAGALT